MHGSLYGRSVAVLIQVTGVHRTTALRWKRAARLPLWLKRLVRVCLDGEIGEIDRAWRDWRICGDQLVSPEGWRFTPGEIRSIPFLHGRIREADCWRRINVQADWIEQRYVVPGEQQAGPNDPRLRQHITGDIPRTYAQRLADEVRAEQLLSDGASSRPSSSRASSLHAPAAAVPQPPVLKFDLAKVLARRRRR